MLTEVYIEALLVDEELADQVWEAWDAGEIGDAFGLQCQLASQSSSERIRVEPCPRAYDLLGRIEEADAISYL